MGTNSEFGEVPPQHGFITKNIVLPFEWHFNFHKGTEFVSIGTVPGDMATILTHTCLVEFHGHFCVYGAWLILHSSRPNMWMIQICQKETDIVCPCMSGGASQVTVSDPILYQRIPPQFSQHCCICSMFANTKNVFAKFNIQFLVWLFIADRCDIEQGFFMTKGAHSLL